MSDETEFTEERLAEIVEGAAEHEANQKKAAEANADLLKRLKYAEESIRDIVVPEWDNVVVRVSAFMDSDLDGYDLDRLTSEDRAKLLPKVIRPAESPFYGLDGINYMHLEQVLPSTHAGVTRRLFNLALRLSGFDD
ncbi:hypothetical protein GCM10010385_58280 [Streptomyces geysiriensis]|uniref:hypothetical protein n=1 Tax=Streptomyces rochei TaxID=1928 RepID=UPI001785DD15|nr:hypothetical protein GCM10010385_58280 [Streptomyces geysiriensis]